jgi:ABC-2 type transport system permease protein
MQWRRSAALARHDLRLLRSDPAIPVILTVMPLVIMAFLKPALRASLVLHGEVGANGAEQAVPGISVMFATFMMGNLGVGVFREHAWATWERLRASPATAGEIMVGKVVVPVLTLLVQLALLFGVGGLAFGLRVRGSIVGVLLIIAALALCLAALGTLVLAVCRSINQLNAFTNVGAMTLTGLAGAITPFYGLPGWAQAIAPATPTYWAMRGFRSVTLSDGGVGTVLLPVTMLLAFAAAFGVLAAVRFRAEDTKVNSSV